MSADCVADEVIAGYQLWRVRVPFKTTMRSSRGQADFGEKVILQLTTSAGRIGLGEASVIFPGRSGETAATILVALKEMFCPRLLGQSPLHISRILDGLESLTSEEFAFPASKCAIDLALHDLKARMLGISVADLLGGAARIRLPLSRSISIMPDEQLIKTAVGLAEQGYRLLTLKGTSDWRADVKTFRCVRAALPDSVLLEIDPNQAWRAKDTIAVSRLLADQGLLCIEQPCAWWDLESMRQATEVCEVPIAADESVLSPADALRVIRMGAADMITVKLAKSGGIRASAMIVEAAVNAGLSCNMGSKHPLGIGTAALLHFAAAYPKVGEFIGYGSALERFVADVINEEVRVEDGAAVLPAGLGLGVSLNLEAVQQFALEHAGSNAA